MASVYSFKYRLKKDEVKEALKKSGVMKIRRRIIQITLFLLLGVYFWASFFLNTAEIINLVIAIICTVFAGVVFAVWQISIRRNVKDQCDGKELSMRITPQKINLSDGNKEWVIKLDGKSSYKIIDDRIIVIITTEKNLVIIPVRAIPKQNTFNVQSIIYENMIAAK